MRSAAESAYGKLFTPEIADRTDLGFSHKKIGIVSRHPCDDFRRYPSHDPADAGGDGGDVIKATANQGRHQDVGSGTDEFSFQTFFCIEALVNGEIVRQLRQGGTGIAYEYGFRRRLSAKRRRIREDHSK